MRSAGGLTALVAALALAGCGETHTIGATAEGGFITNVGWTGSTLARAQAEQHCALFNKKPVFLGDPSAKEVQFKCVSTDR
jgi:hypothetical protein